MGFFAKSSEAQSIILQERLRIKVVKVAKGRSDPTCFQNSGATTAKTYLNRSSLVKTTREVNRHSR